MAWELARRRPLYAPIGFGVWLLFLTVVLAGAVLLWVQPPGTLPVHGPGRLIIYGYRLSWYAAITVVALYVLNLPEKELSTERIMRLLSWMFVYTTIGGLAGIIFADAQFPSLLELVLPLRENSFLYSLVHPSLATVSDFLGYEQARPSAPFAYANAWGNNFGMFLPFFVYSWLRVGAGWRRPAGSVLLLVSLVPIVLSLNRGLWFGLGAAVLFISVKLATMGNYKAVQMFAASVTLAAVAFLASPLYDTAMLRIDTPHSNERRGDLATEVVSGTLVTSPMLGYGDTRAVAGSFASIAGGSSPQCEFCVEPALGTQGFAWRLIYTTGLLGTLLFAGFILTQLTSYVSARDPVSVIGSLVIVLTVLFAFVYDSLESPLFTMMIAVGLMSRNLLRPGQVYASAQPAPRTVDV